MFWVPGWLYECATFFFPPILLLEIFCINLGAAILPLLLSIADIYGLSETFLFSFLAVSRRHKFPREEKLNSSTDFGHLIILAKISLSNLYSWLALFVS